MLSETESTTLLQIAREAIRRHLNQEEYTPAPREEKALNEKSGCFVTLKRNGRLRGCIGNFQSTQPLFREVAAMAVASAVQDPRFQPLQAGELAAITLEITILSALRKVDDSREIEIGTHGIYIEKGLNRGVLLPQVAVEHGWDRETFLQQTCLKAGLPAAAWQSPDAEIYLFSGRIIQEKP